MPVLALEDQGLTQAFHSTLSYAFNVMYREGQEGVSRFIKGGA